MSSAETNEISKYCHLAVVVVGKINSYWFNGGCAELSVKHEINNTQHGFVCSCTPLRIKRILNRLFANSQWLWTSWCPRERCVWIHHWSLDAMCKWGFSFWKKKSKMFAWHALKTFVQGLQYIYIYIVWLMNHFSHLMVVHFWGIGVSWVI